MLLNNPVQVVSVKHCSKFTTTITYNYSQCHASFLRLYQVAEFKGKASIDLTMTANITSQFREILTGTTKYDTFFYQFIPYGEWYVC